MPSFETCGRATWAIFTGSDYDGGTFARMLGIVKKEIMISGDLMLVSELYAFIVASPFSEIFTILSLVDRYIYAFIVIYRMALYFDLKGKPFSVILHFVG